MPTARICPYPIVALFALSASLCVPGAVWAQAQDKSSSQKKGQGLLQEEGPSGGASSGGASPSGAQPSSDQDRADSLFLQGKAAAQAKKWDEAHALLERAWALKQSYDIASNLGQVAYLLGKHAEAAQHVSFALRHYPATGDAEQKRKAQDLLALVRQKVSSLSIRVSPGDAEVFVDGASAGRANALPPELFVDPGERTVEARLGGEVVERRVSAEPGGNYKLELTFANASTAAAPLAATDPVSTSHAPMQPSEYPPTGGPALETKHIAVIVGGALTVGTGIALGVYASKRSNAKSDVEASRDRIEEHTTGPNPCANGGPQECRDLARARDDWESSGRALNILVPTTAVLFAGTVAAYFLWPNDSAPAAAALTPVLTPEKQGVLLTGSF